MENKTHYGKKTYLFYDGVHLVKIFRQLFKWEKNLFFQILNTIMRISILIVLLDVLVGINHPN